MWGVRTARYNAADKNVTAWYLTLFRCSLYLLDALKLKVVARSIQRRSRDIVIFDRYIYDELANLPLDHWLTRRFVQFLLKIVPKPDLPLLLDVDPAEACTRKPEYPEEFLHRNRASFLDIARLADITVIEVRTVEETGSRVEDELARFSRLRTTQFSPAVVRSAKNQPKTVTVKTRVN